MRIVVSKESERFPMLRAIGAQMFWMAAKLAKNGLFELKYVWISKRLDRFLSQSEKDWQEATVRLFS